MNKNRKIVAFGGGTGLATLLSGLKFYSDRITGVVTVTDDGGSSGNLRRELGVLPPGDIRNCLVALADEEKLMAKLFQYRFGGEKELAGHSFGNLFLIALSEICGGFDQAILESSKVLAIRGQVLPVTLENIVLGAKLADGKTVSGETNISQNGKKISRIFLQPILHPKALPGVLKAIEEAEVIILGPGSLYTSILPNLLVEGITEKIVTSTAVKIYICNLMTQKEETSNYTASDHIRAIFQHSREKIFDFALINECRIAPDLIAHYARTGSHPVVIDQEEIKDLGVNIITANLIDKKHSHPSLLGKYARHDPQKLARTIMTILAEKANSQTVLTRR